MNDPDFTLSTGELDLVRGRLGLRRPPYPLEVPSAGATAGERARLTEEAYARLAERGLAAGERLDPELEGLVRVLFGCSVSVDAIGHTDRPLRAVAGADGTSGVLAVQVDDQLRLSRIRPTALATSLVGVLPANEPGPVGPLSVPHRALARAADPDEDDEMSFFGEPDERAILDREGVSGKDAKRLLTFAEQRRCGGQFGVSRGTWRSPTLVAWFDTRDGRYLVVGEKSWVSFAPADLDRIAARVGEALSAVPAPHG